MAGPYQPPSLIRVFIACSTVVCVVKGRLYVPGDKNSTRLLVITSEI